jgi:multiple sugar transport system substrate-binding protein
MVVKSWSAVACDVFMLRFSGAPFPPVRAVCDGSGGRIKGCGPSASPGSLAVQALTAPASAQPRSRRAATQGGLSGAVQGRRFLRCRIIQDFWFAALAASAALGQKRFVPPKSAFRPGAAATFLRLGSRLALSAAPGALTAAAALAVVLVRLPTRRTPGRNSHARPRGPAVARVDDIDGPLVLLRSLVLWAVLCCVSLGLAGCAKEHGDRRVHVVYWEKWTGAEAAAMQATVDAFNASQDRILVEFLSVSGIDRKTILATAGGDPPDVAGVWVQQIASWADLNAILPFDEFIMADGMSVQQFLSRYDEPYAEMTQYRGHVYALYATPSSAALHWNKSLFREAGLDPEHPPRDLNELMEFSKRLTKRDAQTGALTQVGFLPQDPGWWTWTFPRYFGGDLVDGAGNITYDKLPQNLESMRWVQSYTELYGLEDLKLFATSFGCFGSPQYPFFAGRTAMVFQGVWFNNYMRQYAPNLDYGVAAWPSVYPDQEAPFTMIEGDMLVIPRGAKHPREAWEFLKYVNSSNPRARTREQLQGIELTCFLQEKSSPLRVWSPFFTEQHPHPYIGVFRELARSPRAYHVPYIGIWQEYQREINIAFDKVRLLESTPEEAMHYAQSRVAASWQEHQRRLARRVAAGSDFRPAGQP